MPLQRIASNAAANVANGAAIAVFQLGMTGLMARTGVPRDLALWSLAASLAGLAPLLACNLSTAVARRLAAAAQGDDAAMQAGAVMAAAHGLARRVTALGLGLALLLGAAVPPLYPAIAGAHPWTSAGTVAGFFAGSCWVIRAQPAQGWLLDRHRNWPYTGAGLVARGAALAAALGLLAAGLPALALALAAALTLWAAIPLLGSASAAAPADALAQAGERRALRAIMLGFAVWGATSAAIQGATVPMVVWLAPAAAAPFFLAFTLVTVIVGAVLAAANALVSPIAQLLAQGDSVAASALARRTTVLAWLLANASFALAYAALAPLLALWTGAGSADVAEARAFFVWLALQHGLRSAGIVPSIVLATGAAPRTLHRSALPEAALAVLLALPLGLYHGPVGLLAGLALAAGVGTLTVAVVTSRQVLTEHDTGLRTLGAMVALLVALTALGWAALAWSSGG